MFFDNHTMRDCPDVGADFDADEFVGRIADCEIDFATFHARCNQGFAYYDTKVGIRHPSLKYDLFEKIADACKERGIAVSAYFNVGISSEEALRNPDWATLDRSGRIYRDPPLTPDVRTMCYNSPYRDHLLQMIREVAENYPVDGFFLDCLFSFECVCPACIELMRHQGVDFHDAAALKKFNSDSAVRLARDIAATIKDLIPDALINFNGSGRTKGTEMGTYVELECLPSNPGWGYGFLPVMARLFSTRYPDRPLLNMTARFYDWGDFGGLRPQAGLEYDLLYGLALGLQPNIGCHFHPRGTCNHTVFDRVKAVYQTIRQFEPWHENARPISEIAILFPKTMDEIGAATELRGCVAMLTELRHSFTIVTDEEDWNGFRLLILPDTVTLNESLAQRIEDYLSKGGSILATGKSGLCPDESRFALEQRWGARFDGESPFAPAYFRVHPSFSQELPDMPIALYEKGIKVVADSTAEIAATIVAPYYNKHWDGVRAFYYCPPDRESSDPFLIIKEQVAHITHPLFTAYHAQIASLELRQLIDNVIECLLPNPLLRIANVPSFLKALATARPNQTIIHLLAYVPELRGRIQIVEDGVEVPHGKLFVRMSDSLPLRAYLALGRKPVSFEMRDSYVEVVIPPFKGYTMLVLETADKTLTKPT